MSGEETFISLKRICQRGFRTRELRLYKQVALTTAPGSTPKLQESAIWTDNDTRVIVKTSVGIATMCTLFKITIVADNPLYLEGAWLRYEGYCD